jgi:mono/diheme cytochrome c family protein
MRTMLWLALSAAVACGAGARAQDTGDPESGREFAQSVCAECHAVEANRRTSPNRLAPSFVRIANTLGMTKTALLVVLSNPHREMPDLILEREDLNDVAAYIISLKAPR